MKLRERLAYKILIRRILDTKYTPDTNRKGLGTAEFLIDYRWYNIIKVIAGIKPERLIELSVRK